MTSFTYCRFNDVKHQLENQSLYHADFTASGTIDAIYTEQKYICNNPREGSFCSLELKHDIDDNLWFCPDCNIRYPHVEYLFVDVTSPGNQTPSVHPFQTRPSIALCSRFLAVMHVQAYSKRK
jgi:hypothetical protein